MWHLSFRLLTGLLTFACGVAVSALWGLLGGSPAPQTTPRTVGVFVAAPSVAAPAYGDGGGVRLGNVEPRTVVGGVLNGKAVSKPHPAYPAAAKAERVQGMVVVQILVGTDGRVETTHVVSGPALLRQAAAEAVSQWSFSPTLLNGQPVKVSGVVTVNFVLN